MFARSCLLALSLGLVGLVACAPAPVESSVSSKDAIQSTSGGTGKRRDDDGPVLVPIVASGGAAPRPAELIPSAVALDGADCTVDTTTIDPGVGTGWTATVTAHCPSALTLVVRGAGDAAYPQVDLVTTAGEAATTLVVERGTEDGLSDTFTTDGAATASSITTGPAGATRSAVLGTATVVDATSGLLHGVAYDLR